jgi:hypothetical protein
MQANIALETYNLEQHLFFLQPAHVTVNYQHRFVQHAIVVLEEYVTLSSVDGVGKTHHILFRRKNLMTGLHQQASVP